MSYECKQVHNNSSDGLHLSEIVETERVCVSGVSGSRSVLSVVSGWVGLRGACLESAAGRNRMSQCVCQCSQLLRFQEADVVFLGSGQLSRAVALRLAPSGHPLCRKTHQQEVIERKEI